MRIVLRRFIMFMAGVITTLALTASAVLAQTAVNADAIPLPTAQVVAATRALAQLGAIQYLGFVLAIGLFFSALYRILGARR